MPKPPSVDPKSLADYLEAMSRAVFSAGMNWKVIDAKWEGTREAFGRFDPEAVAGYTPDDVERLMADPRVIHNRKKIEAVIRNAGKVIVTARDFGGMDKYLGSFAENDDLVADLHKRFAFLGESVAHFFLFGVRFNPEAQEKWALAHFGDGHHKR